MKIRLATQIDSPLIALLARITFGESFGHLFRDPQDLLDYYELTFSVAKIRNSIRKPINVYLLAYEDKLPVGYAKLKLNSPSEFIKVEKLCQLQKIYVLRDFLSLRIGLALQKNMLKRAIQTGYEHIWLSVLHSNERAINFYKKNGFQQLGSHDFSIGKENFAFIVMSKQL